MRPFTPNDESVLSEVAKLRQHFVPFPEPVSGDYRPSSEIEVKLFDLILLFPFTLTDENEESGRPGHTRGTKRLDSWVSRILTAKDSTHADGGRVWQELAGKFPDPNDANKGTQYSEWLFFHPFIRSFLYESKLDQRMNGNGRSVRILERRDTKNQGRLRVDYSKDGQIHKHTLAFQDVQLYLFDTGVGILAVRLTRDGDPSGEQLYLKNVLDLQDKIRRLYAPYFDYSPESPAMQIAGHCPETVTLQRHEQADIVSYYGICHPEKDDSGRQEFEKHIKHVAEHCEPYTVEVWRELIWPLLPAELSDKPGEKKGHVPVNGAKLRFEHIIDDRMPLLSYVGVDDPRQISPGDWIRLAQVDDSGDSDKYSYSPAFFGGGGMTPFVYDRFWSQSKDLPANAEFQQTRWLCYGYSLISVGAAGDKAFFANEKSGERAYLRYHYFKLALIAHFHRASLLRFKARLAEAVERLQQEDDPEIKGLETFAAELTRIQIDLLAFRNMYWFTEVSNQVQPQELFDLLSRHLRTRELFQQVIDESEKAAQIVVGHNERQQAASAHRISKSAYRLSIVAFVGLVLNIAVTVMQLNLFDMEGTWSNAVARHWLVKFIFSLVATVVAYWLLWILADLLWKRLWQWIRIKGSMAPDHNE